MILFAVVHAPLSFTLPFAIGLFMLGVAYWRRLGRASVPRPRRRLRRAGLLMGLVVGVAGVLAVSILDPDQRPTGYLVAWAAIALLLFPAVLIAAADAIFTVRLHQRSLDRRLARDAQRIRRDVAGASGAGPGHDEASGG